MIYLIISISIVCVLTILYNLKVKNELLKSKLKNIKNIRKDDIYDFESISYYFNQQEINASRDVNEKILNDLNLNDVFIEIDKTISCIGQQYLYSKIRTYSTKDELETQNEITDFFKNNSKCMAKCQENLLILNSKSNYLYANLIYKKKERRNNIKIIYFFTFLSIFLTILCFFDLVFVYGLILVFTVNIYFHYSQKHISEKYISSIVELNHTYNVCNKLIEIPYLNSKLNINESLKKISAIISKTKYLQLEKYLTNELFIFIWIPIEFIKIYLNIESILFNQFLNFLIDKKKQLLNIYNAIGLIDICISRNILLESKSETCIPTYLNENKIEAHEMIHPLIENCISNSININNTGIIVTGSNMSGKSTFIKAIGINTILAHSIGVCFAKYFSLPYLTVFTSIKISDNILTNKSYFLEEIETLKNIIDSYNENNYYLYIIDEILKGTNTNERIAASIAILKFLNKKNVITISTTHDNEIARNLELHNYSNFHFQESVQENQIKFDYKIYDGISKTTNAINIMKLYDFPNEIILDTQKIHLI